MDCSTGDQLWADRYDRILDDFFEIEDDIARRIAGAIEPTLENIEMVRALGRPPETLEAYELLQRGYWHLYRATLEDEVESYRFFEAALAIDPTYAEAVSGLAYLKFRDAHANLLNDFLGRMEDCRRTAAQALELDPRNPRAMRILSGADSTFGNHDVALATIKRAVELCPSYAQGFSGLAFAHDFKGSFSEAIPAADETIRLRPHDPVLHRCIMSKSIAAYQIGLYEGAERIARDSIRTNDRWWISNMMLAASLGKQGRPDAARAAIEKLKKDHPGLTLEAMFQGMPFADAAHREHLAEGLVQAGWRD
jgi:adenylate cyclase